MDYILTSMLDRNSFTEELAAKGLQATFFLDGLHDKHLREAVADLVLSRREESGTPATRGALLHAAHTCPAVLIFEQQSWNVMANITLGQPVFLNLGAPLDSLSSTDSIVVMEVGKTAKKTNAPAGLGRLLWQAALALAKKLGADAVITHNLLTNWPSMSKYGKGKLMQGHIVGYFDQDMIGESRCRQPMRLQENNYLAVILLTPLCEIGEPELKEWASCMRRNIEKDHPFREHAPSFDELLSFVRHDPTISQDAEIISKKIASCLGIRVSFSENDNEFPCTDPAHVATGDSLWDLAAKGLRPTSALFRSDEYLRWSRFGSHVRSSNVEVYVS